MLTSHTKRASGRRNAAAIAEWPAATDPSITLEIQVFLTVVHAKRDGTNRLHFRLCLIETALKLLVKLSIDGKIGNLKRGGHAGAAIYRRQPGVFQIHPIEGF